MKKGVATFTMYLAAGVSIGWLSMRYGGINKPDPSPQPQILAPTPRPVPAIVPTPPWTKEDFISDVRTKLASINTGTYPALEKAFSEWSDDEIRSALNNALGDERTLDQSGTGIAHLLFHEYLKRDFDSALSWYSGLDNIHRGAFALAISHQWPEGRAEEGIKFLLDHPENFYRASPWSLVIKGITSRATMGADAVADLLGKLREKHLDLNFGDQISFPEGFDFGRLASSPSFQGEGIDTFRENVLAAWCREDREAAFDWALLNDKGGRTLASFLTTGGVLGAPDNPWIARKIDGLDPTAKTAVLERMLPTWFTFPASAKSLMDATGDPDLREEIRSRAMQPIFAGRVQETLGLMEDLPDDASRLRYLEKLAKTDFTASRQGRGGLDEASETLLRAKLKEWNAGKRQTEAIVANIKSTKP